MAAPNIVNVSSIIARTSANSLFTNTSNIITNSAGSNTVAKVNHIMVSNYNSSTVTCNVSINKSGMNYLIAGSISVPATSTLVVVGKDTAIYLEEGDVIQANTSSNSSSHIISSYEIIS
jgi:hypothetical protein